MAAEKNGSTMGGTTWMGEPKLSIVAPCHNEGAGLQEFYRRCAAAAETASCGNYEIVLVDDGSRDDTWEVIASLGCADPRAVGVRLMRNFGHQPAASAGLSIARGERVLLIDSDLQDPPELLAAMMDEMDAGADVVYGQRVSRVSETRFKLWSAATFYRLLSGMTVTPIPRDTGDFRLMRRGVVDALAAMPERQRFIRGMVSWIGGKQIALRYERQARYAGRTSYPLMKMIRFATVAITSFSTVPLRAASYLGLASALVALLLLAYSLVAWLQGSTIAGWTSVIAAVTVFGAVQLLVLGVLGEYVGVLFQEIKARPLYLIDRVLSAGLEHRWPAEFSTMPASMRREVVAGIAPAGPVRLSRVIGLRTADRVD